jgi:hypothetical protein
MNEIVTCKYCGKNEYYGEMTWLNGRCECRDCYKSHYFEVYKKIYIWRDKNYTKDELKLLGRTDNTITLKGSTITITGNNTFSGSGTPYYGEVDFKQ